MRKLTRGLMVVRLRTLVRALQEEAEKVWPERRVQRLMADIAARDLIGAERVRVGTARRQRSS